MNMNMNAPFETPEGFGESFLSHFVEGGARFCLALLLAYDSSSESAKASEGLLELSVGNTPILGVSSSIDA